MRKRILFLFIILSFVFGIPFGVLAEDVFDGDPLKIGDMIMVTDFAHVDLGIVKYNDSKYNINIFVGEINEDTKFDREFLLFLLNKLKSGDRCIQKDINSSDNETYDVCPGSSEYNEFVDYVFDSSNEPLGYSFFEPYSTIGGTLTVNLEYPEKVSEKISLNIKNISVLNVSKDSTKTNPVSYVMDDGTIVLKDLEKEGYDFEGWYLDRKYQFRVKEITQELVDEYFSEDGKYSDIEKNPVEEVNGEFVGNIDLYEKWVDNRKLTNPQTLSTIGIVSFVTAFVGVICLVIFVNRNQKNNENL